MSRARNIKPGFFRNELLVELPFEYRLLFIGIWTMADREGRLEDRPTKIKMEVFPADDVDVNAGLSGLHDKGFIARYSANGCRYIQVLAWSKHQNPHVKESASSIPAPDLHGASTVQAPEIPVRAGLIPSSLIPDSLEKKKTCRAEARRFADFWAVYPRSEGKKPALAVWKSKGLDASADEIIADVGRRIAEHRQWRDGYIPHAQKYLRNELWTDAIDSAAPRAGPTSKYGAAIVTLEEMKHGPANVDLESDAAIDLLGTRGHSGR